MEVRLLVATKQRSPDGFALKGVPMQRDDDVLAKRVKRAFLFQTKALNTPSIASPR